MSEPNAAPTVAVINTSEDVVALLATAVELEGFRPVTAYVPDFREGRAAIDDFLREHDPAAILWDIAIPYAENWAYFQHVRGLDAARGRRFVLTTTNKRALDAQVGDTGAFEIIGRPFDLDELMAAVRRAVAGG